MSKPYRFKETFSDRIGLYIQYQEKSSDMHWHEHYEITLCIDGEAYSVINNERSLFKKGDVLFLTPSDFHSLKVLSPLSLITLTFNLTHLPYSSLIEVLYSTDCKLINLTEKEFNNITFYLNVLQYELNEQHIHSAQYIRYIFSCILIELFRHKDTNSLSSYPNNIKKILHYINIHFKEQISLKDVADYAEISYSNAGKYIKKYINMSFLEYLNNIRLEYSCRLLLNSTESITDIAEFSGFSSIEHFSKTFKSKYGITPKQYRDQHTSN